MSFFRFSESSVNALRRFHHVNKAIRITVEEIVAVVTSVYLVEILKMAPYTKFENYVLIYLIFTGGLMEHRFFMDLLGKCVSCTRANSSGEKSLDRNASIASTDNDINGMASIAKYARNET